MTALSPGASPPPVFNAILMVLGSLLQYGNDFAGFGVASRLRLLENRFAVGHDLEASALRRDQADFRFGKTSSYFRRQTGGAGLVRSNGAVFDADFHGSGNFSEK
jgi:hypothetical protein